MSEPKTVAAAVNEVVPGLFHYKIDDERIKSQSDSYAVVKDGRVVLIDPLPLEASLLHRLGRVEAIVLGARSHQRSSWRLRREHQAAIHAPQGPPAWRRNPMPPTRRGTGCPAV